MIDRSILHGLVIFYLKEKNRIIEELTGVSLINENDIDNIKYHWSEQQVITFFKNFKSRSFICDTDACPWCINNYRESYNVHGHTYGCNKCYYGEGHGYCVVNNELNWNSTYGKIINKLNEMNIGRGSIVSIPEMVELIGLIKNMFEDFLQECNFSYEDLLRKLAKEDYDY